MYCLCVNMYCHRVTTKLQLTNIYQVKSSTCFPRKLYVRNFHKGNFRQGNSRSYVNLNAFAACDIMNFCSGKTLVQFKRDGRHDVTIMQQTLAVREEFVFP
jgi:hypothetical protein